MGDAMIYFLLSRTLRWGRRLPESWFFWLGDAYWLCLRRLYSRPCRICGGNRSLCFHEEKVPLAFVGLWSALVLLVLWGAL